MPLNATTARSFMLRSLEQAQAAAKLGEVPIGAVVVYDGEIIAEAHNEVETLKDPTAHAEILAMRRAAAKLGDWRLSECALFVTLEPCPMCAGALVLSRVKELYFGCYDPRQGAVGSLFNLAEQAELPHQVRVYPEILKDECMGVLQEFFRSVRRHD